jgi:hypothetical protein
MRERVGEKKTARPKLIRGLGYIAVPTALIVGISVAKPFGVDPIGSIENQRQPTCTISAPNHKIELSLLITEADGSTSIYSTHAVMKMARSPFDYLGPGETIAVPHIGRSACTEVKGLVPSLPVVS